MSPAEPDPFADPEWRAANRRLWDERVPIHVAGDFYDVPGFLAGAITLRDFEREDLGDVTGRELLHLQCHFGLDTLSWARLGARVTGLDFSEPAIEAARSLAAQLELEAHFVQADVYSAAERLGRQYDIVYTGLGALCWLPDIERWADQIHALLRPGGIFYLAEFHPIGEVFADDSLDLAYDYFGNDQPRVWDEPGTYADLEASTRHNRSYEWVHPVSRVLDALARRGLRLERFREHDHTLYRRWPFLERDDQGAWRLPETLPSLPLMYSARFLRPMDPGPPSA